MSVGKGVKLGFGIGIGIALFLLVIVLAVSLLDWQVGRMRQQAELDHERSGSKNYLRDLMSICWSQASDREDMRWPSDIRGCLGDEAVFENMLAQSLEKVSGRISANLENLPDTFISLARSK